VSLWPKITGFMHLRNTTRTLRDNMSHSIALIAIVEEDQVVPLCNEVIATLLDNNMEMLSGLKGKKPSN